MTSNPVLPFVLGILGSSLFGGTYANACTCAKLEDPEAAYVQASAVLYATIEKVELRKAVDGSPYWWNTLAVEKIWKTDGGSVNHIVTWPTCDSKFIVGHTWILFAGRASSDLYSDEDVLVTSACSMSAGVTVDPTWCNAYPSMCNDWRDKVEKLKAFLEARTAKDP